MELICPSCEARYEIPEGAIGAKGRQVSCMNCGHAWHAQPPLVLGDPRPAILRAAPAAATPVQTPVRGDAFAEGLDEMDGRDDRAMPPSSRSEQLAEIRQMLAEVQSENAGSTTAGTARPQDYGPAPGVAAAVDAERFGDFDDEDRGDFEDDFDDTAEPAADYSDPLREKLDAQSRKEELAQRPPNMDKHKRRHARREGKHRRARAAGSGAFMTGFLLIVIIAAVLVALYLLKPEIVAQMPGTEQAMNDYTDTIDSIRDKLGSTLGGVRDWFVRRTEGLFA